MTQALTFLVVIIILLIVNYEMCNKKIYENAPILNVDQVLQTLRTGDILISSYDNKKHPSLICYFGMNVIGNAVGAGCNTHATMVIVLGGVPYVLENTYYPMKDELTGTWVRSRFALVLARDVIEQYIGRVSLHKYTGPPIKYDDNKLRIALRHIADAYKPCYSYIAYINTIIPMPVNITKDKLLCTDSIIMMWALFNITDELASMPCNVRQIENKMTRIGYNNMGIVRNTYHKLYIESI